MHYWAPPTYRHISSPRTIDLHISGCLPTGAPPKLCQCSPIAVQRSKNHQSPVRESTATVRRRKVTLETKKDSLNRGCPRSAKPIGLKNINPHSRNKNYNHYRKSEKGFAEQERKENRKRSFLAVIAGLARGSTKMSSGHKHYEPSPKLREGVAQRQWRAKESIPALRHICTPRLKLYPMSPKHEAKRPSRKTGEGHCIAINDTKKRGHAPTDHPPRARGSLNCAMDSVYSSRAAEVVALRHIYKLQSQNSCCEQSSR